MLHSVSPLPNSAALSYLLGVATGCRPSLVNRHTNLRVSGILRELKCKHQKRGTTRYNCASFTETSITWIFHPWAFRRYVTSYVPKVMGFLDLWPSITLTSDSVSQPHCTRGSAGSLSLLFSLSLVLRCMCTVTTGYLFC